MKEIHVMIVSDDEDDREFLQSAFHKQVPNPRFTGYNTGQPAINYLTGTKSSSGSPGNYPHILLLDVHLPGKSGYAILVEIKQDAALWHIPVMMLSTSLVPKDREQCLAAGCEWYCVKPVLSDGYDVIAANAISYFNHSC